MNELNGHCSKSEFPKKWEVKKFEDLLDYIQPTPYIVTSTDYADEYDTPVLTAGKTFVLGNTNEKDGIFKDYPVIIFDDFTTANKFVNFSFKVKSSAMKILKPKSKDVNIKFIFYYMQTVRITFDTHKRYWISVFAKLPVPYPPPSIQQQIVFQIEELFSELDKSIEQLKTAQQQLKVYRQSVLQWAFEGKLTNENVKDGELPEGWQLKLLSDVSNKITDGEHFRPITVDKGIYFLSAKDVRDNGVDFSDPLFVSEETAAKALQRCNPQKGDILIVSRGATVGRMCIVNTEKVFCLLGSVILIKTKSSVNSKYLTYTLKSPRVNRKLITISGATAQQAIYLRDIKNIGIPVPTIQEQNLIVQEIESRLSVADKLEETITNSLQQAEALRQSILKKAFEGELVYG